MHRRRITLTLLNDVLDSQTGCIAGLLLGAVVNEVVGNGYMPDFAMKLLACQ